MKPSIRVEGLKEFRKALKRAENANPKVLTKALKEAGKPVHLRMRVFAPSRTGKLVGSIGVPRASGTKGRIPVKARHAAIIEFARKGRLGQTLTSRYGSPPRFGYKAVEAATNEVIDILEKELKEIITIHGWAK